MSDQISIYIHWPFCLSLCPYCDFNSHLFTQLDQDQWLVAYEKEIDFFAHKIKGKFVKSIFFGGGTPSLMQPKIVAKILEKIAVLGAISKDTEITLEANPTSYEAKKFQEFKAAGINRVSIGVQSFKEQSLKILGRKHSADEAMDAIKSASKIFDRYSFDLIYAIPEQTLADWQEEIKFALDLAGGHISLYQLTIEKGTPFYKLFHNGELKLPSNDLAASMYEWTNEYLKKCNYGRYEISNYAIVGQECVHNLCYWNYDEYIGIGAGAHSRLHEEGGIQAIMMIHKPEMWRQAVLAKGNGVQSQNMLLTQEIIEEALMMGLRLAEGILESKFMEITYKRFQDVLNPQTTSYYIENGLLENWSDHRLRLTDKGLMLHNYLVPRMIG